MYDYAKCSDADLKKCGDNIAALGGGASIMEDAANKIVNYLYDNIADSSGGKANALVRFYKTHPYGQLDLGLQGFAQGILGSAPSDDTNCLTMLATMGDKHDWKSRSKSNGHRIIIPQECNAGSQCGQIERQQGRIDLGSNRVPYVGN